MNERGQMVGYAEKATPAPKCIAPQKLAFAPVLWGPKSGDIYFCSTRSTDTDPLTPSGSGLENWILKFGEDQLLVTVLPDNWTTSSFRCGSGSLDLQRPSILGRKTVAPAV